MGPPPDSFDILPRAFDPAGDELSGEDLSGQQEVVILLQTRERLFKVAWRRLERCCFLGRQRVQIAVERTQSQLRGVKPTPDPVHAGHHHRRVRKVRVARGIRRTQLNAPLRRTTYSLRAPTRSEVAEAQPTRVRIVEVGHGVGVADLVDAMAVPELKAEWFEALNGLKPGDALTPGQKVKVVK